MFERNWSKPAPAKSGVNKAPQPSLRRPSIKDIARLAHVSHPTVSRALQNSPLVNAVTAERIRRIAAEAGYHASAVARGLVTRRTQTIGLVMTSVADPYAGQIACGVEQTAADHGYAVFLANSDADPAREQKVVEALAERRVDGILIASPRMDALYLPLLEQLRVPIVLVNGRHPGRLAHSVLIEEQQGIRTAVEYLIEMGHQRIAYIGNRLGYQAEAEQLAGYQKALARAGIAFVNEWVAQGDGWPESSADAMHAVLRIEHPPTAVCCFSDMAALGAIQAIRARRLRVPQDVSVVGFGDLYFAASLEPALTTVRVPLRHMGELAAEDLIRQMNKEASIAEITVETELIVRESTGRLRTHGERHQND